MVGQGTLRLPARRALTHFTDPHLSIFRTRPWMLRDLPFPRWVSLPKVQTHSEAHSADLSLKTAPSSLVTTKACATVLKRCAKRLYPTKPCETEISAAF